MRLTYTAIYTVFHFIILRLSDNYGTSRHEVFSVHFLRVSEIQYSLQDYIHKEPSSK